MVEFSKFNCDSGRDGAVFSISETCSLSASLLVSLCHSMSLSDSSVSSSFLLSLESHSSRKYNPRHRRADFSHTAASSETSFLISSACFTALSISTFN